MTSAAASTAYPLYLLEISNAKYDTYRPGGRSETKAVPDQDQQRTYLSRIPVNVMVTVAVVAAKPSKAS
jgi:hypothetical protein